MIQKEPKVEQEERCDGVGALVLDFFYGKEPMKERAEEGACCQRAKAWWEMEETIRK
jgi:hypothetical protein